MATCEEGHDEPTYQETRKKMAGQKVEGSMDVGRRDEAPTLKEDVFSFGQVQEQIVEIYNAMSDEIDRLEEKLGIVINQRGGSPEKAYVDPDGPSGRHALEMSMRELLRRAEGLNRRLRELRITVEL